MSLNTDLDKLFADMSKQSASNPMNGIEGITEPTPTPVTPVTPDLATAPASTPKVDNVPPAAAAPVQSTQSPSNTQVNVDDTVADWDADVKPDVAPTTPTPVAPTAPTFDFSDIAKVLGAEQIQDKAALIEAISTVKSKVDAYSNIPDKLAKAIEIANLNGDYLNYLGVSQIDWGKEDPVQLYENYVINQFTNPSTGAVDFEKVDKLLDRIEEDEKELRGLELQKTYINQQAFQKNQIEQQARIQRQNFESELKRSIDGIADIAGYKLTPSHKQELYSYIVNGEDLKEPSISQRVQNAFIKKNFSKIDSFRKQQIRNSVKRELLDEAVVPDIKPVSATPDLQPHVGYTMDSFLKELEAKQKKKF